MKKFVIIAYIMLISIISISGFFIYKVIAKDNEDKEEKEKAIANVEFLEHELVNIFNEINNIKFENYTLSATNIEKKQNKEETENSSKSDSGSGGTQGSSESSKSSSGENSQNESSNNKQYKMEKTGVLTNQDEINWTQIKSEVERVYTLLNITTADLYQIETDTENIEKFNDDFDNFTKSVNDENKTETLKTLSLLYDYMPEFFENCTDNKSKIIVIKTKNNIFKAYSILENNDWDKIKENVEKALKEFEHLTTNENNINKYDIDKTYIMIKELKNAVNMQSKEIFLIKYKNILEELENI